MRSQPPSTSLQQTKGKKKQKKEKKKKNWKKNRKKERLYTHSSEIRPPRTLSRTQYFVSALKTILKIRICNINFKLYFKTCELPFRETCFAIKKVLYSFMSNARMNGGDILYKAVNSTYSPILLSATTQTANTSSKMCHLFQTSSIS